MKMPYDQRPSVTIGALPSSRWFSSGRSSTNGATRPTATSAPIAVFTVNCAALLGTNPAGPASGEAGPQVAPPPPGGYRQPASRQPVLPTKRGVDPLGQQHARREPGEERRRPRQRIETGRSGEREPAPKPAGDSQNGDRRYPAPNW